MVILGINAYHGDASAALLVDGKLVAAVEEERFRRVKHVAGFPSESIRMCLVLSGISPRQIDYFALSRNPHANFHRKLFFALRHSPSVRLLTDRVRNSLRVSQIAQRIGKELSLDAAWVEKRLFFVEHHLAHLASSFFVSPFEEAAVFAMDGFGDFVSTSFAHGKDRDLKVLGKVYFPHSLGMFYLGLTQYLGFPQYGDEYKVMALAAYGRPEYAQELRQLIHGKADGAFRLDLTYFRHHSDGVSMTWEDGEPILGSVNTQKLQELLGPARKPEDPITPRHQAIAASCQSVFEESAFRLLNQLYEKTRIPRLCLAGGCALNSVLNGKIRLRTPFTEVYIQPAAADSGTAIGAAFFLYHQVLGQPRRFTLTHAFWGPEFHEGQLSAELQSKAQALGSRSCRWRRQEDEEQLCRQVARRLSEGKIVGWFQGRMEWGPRALGNRSILADPRRAEMRETLNRKIKLREDFRPFAPSLLEESLGEYFLDAASDPFMIRVYPIRPEKRRLLPAVTHVDGSGRLQTVSRDTQPLFWKLLKTFEGKTGIPVLLNTSFNENEPIVHTPQEALDCFLRTGMDILVLGRYIVEKDKGHVEAEKDKSHVE